MATKELTPTAARAAQIREALKHVYGWTSRQVSVKTHNYSMGSSINVHINDPDIDLVAVKRIAEGHERVDRDQFGDILSGGNRFVFVTYGREAEQAHTARYLAPVVSALSALESGSNRLMPIAGTPYLVGQNGRLTLWHKDTGHVCDCYDAAGLACRLGARMVAQS